MIFGFGEKARLRRELLASQRRLEEAARTIRLQAKDACSRLLQATPGLEMRPVPVAGPLAEVIEEYRARAGDDREILYIEDGGGDWLRASIDRRLFVRAMRELLDNSLRHAGDWRRITVTSEPISGAVVVKVRDDGRGMPDGVAGADGSPGPGAGLGLSLVRRIVEAHGGRLNLSTEPGFGTSVSTLWPEGEAEVSPTAGGGSP